MSQGLSLTDYRNCILYHDQSKCGIETHLQAKFFCLVSLGRKEKQVRQYRQYSVYALKNQKTETKQKKVLKMSWISLALYRTCNKFRHGTFVHDTKVQEKKERNQKSVLYVCQKIILCPKYDYHRPLAFQVKALHMIIVLRYCTNISHIVAMFLYMFPLLWTIYFFL